MKIYLVGGAVRDKLLGLPVKERDWVVVGATVDDMLNQGYRQVGKEFPVFLHPKTKEEYALARMERKVKPGYKGFVFDTSPDVTLQNDLMRRDLTINAMAETLEGDLIDPYHGKEDLEKRVLRHVSPAFSEDPVRILRVGRFLARYAHLGFHIAAETMTLMQKMVAAGEVNALVAERVWKELERALSEKNPEEFFVVLAESKALAILFPHHHLNGKGMKALKSASRLSNSPIIRFAALMHGDKSQEEKHAWLDYINDICNRYRAPNAYRELAKLIASHYMDAIEAKTFSADELLKLFNSLDIYRRGERFQNFLLTTQAIAMSLGKSFDHKWLWESSEVAKSYNVQNLIAKGLAGKDLANELAIKRRDKIEEWLKGSIKS